MKLKLDENLGRDVARALRGAGDDVATVPDQSMWGASDRELIETCRREGRCIVTLDLEFGNPLVFRPSEYSGIVVLRLRHRPSPHDLIDVVHSLIGGLAQDIGVAGKLWTVERGRLRVYDQDEID